MLITGGFIEAPPDWEPGRSTGGGVGHRSRSAYGYSPGQLRAALRELGLPLPRIPTYESFRLRQGGWSQALAAAAITDTEIANARAELAARNSIVLAATGCTLSAWRRLLTGRYEPSLELVVTLAGVLDRASADVCR